MIPVLERCSSSAPRRFSTPALLVPAWVVSLVVLAGAFTPYQQHQQRLRQHVLVDHSIVRLPAEGTLTLDPHFPKPRSMTIEGEAYVKSVAGPAPMRIELQFITLTIRGDALVHVVAKPNESGEEVDVLFGDVTVQKNYPSAFPEPDRLGAGEMSLINITIDLMEKEKLDAASVREMSAVFSADEFTMPKPWECRGKENSCSTDCSHRARAASGVIGPMRLRSPR
jgi:hypothetical protein